MEKLNEDLVRMKNGGASEETLQQFKDSQSALIESVYKFSVDEADKRYGPKGGTASAAPPNTGGDKTKATAQTLPDVGDFLATSK